jgi:hypothetical protein
MKVGIKTVLFLALAGCLLFGAVGEAKLFPRLFGKVEKKPSLPTNPVAKAAVQGLYDVYTQSAMYEIRNVFVIRYLPMVPTEAFVDEHDPQELYCVCTAFESRYKVPWNEDSSAWVRQVRNILVMLTKGGYYLAMQPSGICPDNCE